MSLPVLTEGPSVENERDDFRLGARPGRLGLGVAPGEPGTLRS